MKRSTISAFFLSLIPVISMGQALPTNQFQGLAWRNIGPFRGGRVSSVAGAGHGSGVFYIGLPAGGVWKTTNAGATWDPVFDAVKSVCSIGSVAVAPSNPNVVYAGSGELISVIFPEQMGDGIYRSDDAGKTWRNIGLPNSVHIPTILVDPKDPDLAIVAAIGPRGKPSEDRGVYRTTDGGKTWTKTLFVSPDLGVQHLSWAADDPQVIYASTMAAGPGAGSMWIGGTEAAKTKIYKSTDEGLTWTPVKGTGLPTEGGRICTAVAPGSQGKKVYDIGTFGLYESEDGGDNWKRLAADDSRIANGQGPYTSGVYIDSTNPNVIYTVATCVYRSTDGGNTFEAFKGSPGGDDPQQMWVDPQNGDDLLLGGDQGAAVSLDAGRTWSSWYNQPTGQIRSIDADCGFPYWVYGVMQDSNSIATASASDLGEISPVDWRPYPGGEFGTLICDPLDPTLSYAPGPASSISRITFPSGKYSAIGPEMDSSLGLRGGPHMAFSPVDPHKFYIAMQKVVLSTDHGDHWRAISPDLSEDTAKPVKGKPVETNMSTTTCISVSGAKDGVIWVGMSDGKLKITKDDGRTWETASIAPPGMEKVGYIRALQADPVNVDGAYAAVAVSNDPGAHVFRTEDLGKTWKDASKGLPTGGTGENAIVDLRADPHVSGILFAITSAHVYYSRDAGANWQLLDLNLPTTDLTDLVIHGNDLLLSTYGRGIWILDDYSVLTQLSPQTSSESVHLFKPADPIRFRRSLNQDTPFPPEAPHAANPPLGAIIDYSLTAKPNSVVKLEIIDSTGRVIRHMSSQSTDPYLESKPWVPTFWLRPITPLPTEVGLNRINWDLRYDDPPTFNHEVAYYVGGGIPGDTPQQGQGPLAGPGEYKVRLTVDGRAYVQSFSVRPDPRMTGSLKDLNERLALNSAMYDGILEAYAGYQSAAAMREQLKAYVGAAPANGTPTNSADHPVSADIQKAATELDKKLAEFGGAPMPGVQPRFQFLVANLGGELGTLDGDDSAPSEGVFYSWGAAWTQLHTESNAFRGVCDKEVAEFNKLLAKSGLKAITFSPLQADPPAPGKKYLPEPAKEKTNMAAVAHTVIRSDKDNEAPAGQ